MGIDDKRWAELAGEAQFSELGRLREQATNWRTGLAGLTGLLTAVTIIKGPDTVKDLTEIARISVAALLAAALAALLTGSVLGMRAAYGTPGPEMMITGERLRAWTRNEVRTVRSRLVFSSVLFVAGMVLVALAIGVTWLSSAPRPAGLFSVTTATGTTCGRLAGGDAGRVLITTGSGDAPAVVPLALSAVRGLTPVDGCPRG